MTLPNESPTLLPDVAVAFLEALPAGTVLFDRERALFRGLNRRGWELLGWSPSSPHPWGDEPLGSLVHPEDLPRVRVQLATWRSLPAGSTAMVTARVRGEDGTFRELELEVAPFSPELLLGSLRSVGTHAHPHGEELPTATQRAAAQRMARLGSWDLLPGSGQMRWSEPLSSLLGVDLGTREPTFSSFVSAFEPEDRSRIETLMAEVAHGMAAQAIEARLRRADGSLRLYRVEASCVDEPQTGRYLSGTVLDVTDQLQGRYEDLPGAALQYVRRKVWQTRYLFDVHANQPIWISRELPELAYYGGVAIEQLDAAGEGSPLPNLPLPQVPGLDPTCAAGVHQGLAHLTIRSRAEDGMQHLLLFRQRVFARNVDGEPTHVFGQIDDITNPMMLIYPLEYSLGTLRAGADRLQGALRFDPRDGWVTLAHRESREIDVQRLAAAEARAEVAERLRVWASAESSPLILEFPGANRRWYRLEWSGPASESGTGLAPVVLVHDITERHLHDERVRGHEALFRQTFARAPIGIALTSTEGYFIETNDAFQRMLGYTNAELRAMRFRELTAPDDRRDASYLTGQLLSGKVDSIQLEKGYICKDGSTCWALATASLFADSETGQTYFITQLIDISARRRAEASLRELNQILEGQALQRAEELVAANQELETIESSISHDLHQPVRQIRQLAVATLQDHAERLPLDAREFLESIAGAASRVQRQLDVLQELARTSRSELEREPLDLSQLVEGLHRELERLDPTHAVTWRIEPGLIALADPELARIALRQLIEHAWHYTRGVANPSIAFEADPSGVQGVYCVCDNGASLDEFVGAELAARLALVDRIMRRHGGALWSEPGLPNGARVCFTLGPVERPRRALSRERAETPR